MDWLTFANYGFHLIKFDRQSLFFCNTDAQDLIFLCKIALEGMAHKSFAEMKPDFLKLIHLSELFYVAIWNIPIKDTMGKRG